MVQAERKHRASAMTGGGERRWGYDSAVSWRIRVRASASVCVVVVLVAVAPGVAPARTHHGSVKMMCASKDGRRYVAKRKPHSCTIFGRNGGFAGGFALRHLHWYSWGGGTATATGRSVGFHHGPGEGVGVQPYRIRRGRCGRVYTRMSLSFKRGPYLSRQIKLRKCPGAV